MRRLLLLCTLTTSCTSYGVYRQPLMPAPALVAEGLVDPFEDGPHGDDHTVLYATDRDPAGPEHKERFYRYERGRVLRFGEAHVHVDVDEDLDWATLVQESLSSDREHDYEMLVDEVTEYGVYDRSVPSVLPTFERSEVPANRFAAAVERRLYGSSHRDVFVYVHGYKAEFTYPVLVAAELWHYLGYNGAFVAYSWTATPNPLAYFKDIESAAQTTRNLRLLLEFLADRTSARKIHILGYSAGTRVVTGALHQLALEHSGATREELAEVLRLGHVVLVGADVDRDLLAGFVDDGLLNLPETFTIYQSAEDGPLGFAERVFGRQRTGQLTDSAMTRDSVLFCQAYPWFQVIDVTPAEGGTKGNGHGYFLKSPWASNDILLTFWTGLPPGERGLVRRDDGWRWTFPDDYVEGLRTKFCAAQGDAVEETPTAAP